MRYGLLDEIVNNDTNVTMEDFSEVQSNETVRNKSTQIDIRQRKPIAATIKQRSQSKSVRIK